MFACIYVYVYAHVSTVEPLSNGQFDFGAIKYIERLSSLRGEMILPWSYRDHRTCPL